MATFHSALLQAVNGTLGSLPSVPATRVYQQRQAPVEREECPCVNLMQGNARTIEALGSEGEWDVLRVSVQFSLAVHTSGDPVTTVADPILAQVHTALFADPSLGGKALRLRFLGSQVRPAAANATAAIHDLQYEAEVLVNERNLALITP